MFLSRDETVPHNHMQALFIYNLEPSYMGGKPLGSHICKKMVLSIILILLVCLLFKK